MPKRFLLLPLLVLFSFYYGSGQSLRFNGSSNYVKVNSSAALQLHDFTLEAWINIQGTGATTGTEQGNENGGFKASTVVPLITKGRREKGGAAAAINYFFGYQASDRRLIADFEDNGTTGTQQSVVGSSSLPTNKWTHVAVTYSTSAHTWNLYINGQLDKSSNVSGNGTPQSGSTVPVAIASALNSGSSAEGFFNGMIDEVRIWNVARQPTEISSSYNAELTSGTGLVARYGFNENRGTTAANSISGTAPAGQLINSPQWTLGFNQTAPTNQPPVLSPIGNKSVTVGQTLTFTATATDPDAGQTKTFSLIGAPSGATINSSTGAFSWTPSATGSYPFTVRVSDNGTPILTDDETITVTVNPVGNRAPVLNAIGNKSVTVGQQLTFTATASDPDAGQTLTFSLIGAPSGASIGSSSGAFSWTPTTTGSYPFTVRVSDNGTPVLTDDETITVTVNPVAANTPPNAPTNPSPADAGTSSYNSTSLCVTATDADNDPLRVRFYGRKKLTNKKFTVIMIPDTQYYTEDPQGSNGAYNIMFKTQTSWIVNNRVSKNIAYVGHLGDCVEHGDTFEVEWKRVDTAMKTIEDPSLTGLIQGMPYGVCVGNHDQTLRGDPLGTTTFYNKYFGSSRYTGRAYYGGHKGTNNDNNYQLFSAGGIDFLVISPEYDQTTNFTATGGALDWGENLIKQYPNRKVIIMTHYLLTGSATWSAQGQALYDRYKVYPNVIFMVGGHISANTGESRRTDTYNGNTIQSVVSDYQSRTNGGNGLLRIYTFDPATNTVATQTYSPYTNTFETDASSQFTLSVNLATTADAYTLVGEISNVTSGSNVCASWPSLMDNTTYEWYAEVYDGKTTTTGPVWSFTTKSVASMASANEPLTLINEETTSGNQGFAIYPNPNNIHHLTLSLPAEIKGTVHVEITDLMGKVQLRKDFKEVANSIHLNYNLTPGTYMVVLKTNSNRITKKLVVVE